MSGVANRPQIVVPGTSSGLVSASGLPGQTVGSTIGAGFVGECVQTTNSGVALSNGGQNTVVTLVIPSAGDWDISGCAAFNGTGITVTGNQYLLSISGTTNAINGSQGLPDANGQIRLQLAPFSCTASNEVIAFSIPSYQYLATASKTFFLVLAPNFTAGSMTGQGFLTARRRS